MPQAGRSWIRFSMRSLDFSVDLILQPHCGVAAVSGQQLGKQISAATDTNARVEERCFLCGPFRDVISK
jgi:hypothetical protein